MWNQSLAELFAKGGPIMWPLLFCSILGIAIIIERLIFFTRLRLNEPKFHDDLRISIRAGRTTEALARCHESSHPVCLVAVTYLENVNEPETLRQDLIKRDGSLELERASKRLRPLATIAHLSPLIGLLGTVAGMVTAFSRIEALGGSVNPAELAGGIWEALLTTVFGLLVAIPCMAAFHSFESSVDKIMRRMELIVTSLDEWFGKKTDTRLSGTSDRDAAAISAAP